MVQLVSAVIRPSRLDAVVEALHVAGITAMTTTAANGSGDEGGTTVVFRGSESHSPFTPKVRLEILCDTFDAERIAQVIATAACTGTVGDGVVWISEVASARAISGRPATALSAV